MDAIAYIDCEIIIGWEYNAFDSNVICFDSEISPLLPTVMTNLLYMELPVNLKNNPTSPMNSVFNNIRYHLSFGLLTLRHWDYPRDLRLINAPTPANLLNNPYETNT